MSKSIDDLAHPQIQGQYMILILRTKVKVIDVCNTSSLGDTLLCLIWYDYVKDTETLRSEHEAMKIKRFFKFRLQMYFPFFVIIELAIASFESPLPMDGLSKFD